jgi:hypothetical protein
MDAKTTNKIQGLIPAMKSKNVSICVKPQYTNPCITQWKWSINLDLVDAPAKSTHRWKIEAHQGLWQLQEIRRHLSGPDVLPKVCMVRSIDAM